jgi:anti-sigma factor RsiW
MDHEQAKEKFSDLFEESLDQPTRQAVQEHLDACAACRADYAAFQQTLAPLRRLHRVTAPTELRQTVPALIHRRSRGRFFGARTRMTRVPVEWISLIMLGLVAAAYLLVKWTYPVP